MQEFTTYTQRLEAAADILVPAIVSIFMNAYKGEIRLNQEQQSVQIAKVAKTCHKARKIR